MSTIRKYHNHKLQTTPWHHEEVQLAEFVLVWASGKNTATIVLPLFFGNSVYMWRKVKFVLLQLLPASTAKHAQAAYKRHFVWLDNTEFPKLSKDLTQSSNRSPLSFLNLGSTTQGLSKSDRLGQRHRILVVLDSIRTLPFVFLSQPGR